MDKLEYIPVAEAKSARKVMKKSKVVEEVETMLKKLPAGQAGKIVANSERPQTIKNRIIRVGKSMEMKHLTVKRAGETIYFWNEK
jgi:hypothetical protein